MQNKNIGIRPTSIVTPPSLVKEEKKGGYIMYVRAVTRQNNVTL